MIFTEILREFQNIYSGIERDEAETKRHIQSVLNLLNDILESPLRQNRIKPREKPVCKYLEGVIEAGKAGRFSSLYSKLSPAVPYLHWDYGYTSMPAHLEHSYAYTEIAGPKGNISARDIASGFVLLAPGCSYPEHSHPGIEESYIGLSGHVIQNDNEPLEPGDFIFNRKGKKHSLHAGPDAPCLVAYTWLAPPDVLSGYSMKFT